MQSIEGLKRTKKADPPPRKREFFLPMAFELGRQLFSHLWPRTMPLPYLILSPLGSDWNSTSATLGVHLAYAVCRSWELPISYNPVSQFLIIHHIFTSYWFCFPGEPRKHTTGSKIISTDIDRCHQTWAGSGKDLNCAVGPPDTKMAICMDSPAIRQPQSHNWSYWISHVIGFYYIWMSEDDRYHREKQSR